MKRRTFALLTAVITFAVGIALAKLWRPTLFKTPQPAGKEILLSNYRLSGPYVFEELSVYLIHGPDAPGSRAYVPLQNAVERGIVEVYETHYVNELTIQNVSARDEVFVQAGDIVKGGRQDRVLAVDMILPARSGHVPIAAFCVERGRWQQRGAESMDQFSMTEMTANYSLRQVIKDVATQAGVWLEVESSQKKVAAGVADSVRSEESPTSLPLALESDAVQASTAPYVDNLLSIVHVPSAVIGVAFAINDEIKGADVYSSTFMFEWFWPRLLKAAAIEAVAAPRIKRAPKPLTVAIVSDFLVNAELGVGTITDVNARTQSVKVETEDGLFFETRDTLYGGAWIHRSYLARKQ